jgi:hypothetical protein
VNRYFVVVPTVVVVEAPTRKQAHQEARAAVRQVDELIRDNALWGWCTGCGTVSEACGSSRNGCCPDCRHPKNRAERWRFDMRGYQPANVREHIDDRSKE